MKLLPHPSGIVFATFGCSLLLYLVGLVLPYPLFPYVAATPISFPEIARRQPLPAAAFLTTFLALFGLYTLTYQTCRQHPRRVSPTQILLSGLTLAILLSLTYPVGAGDVVDYVTHGEELFFFRQNPLVVPPGQIPDAAFARYSAYRMAVSNYGPLWTWISGLVVGVLGRESLALNLLGFKGIAIVAYLAQALLVYSILRRRDPDLAPAGLAFFAWNPLVLYEFAVNGHNDAAMMAFALLGIFFWERRRPLLMTAALTLAFLVKIPMFPLLPLFLLAAARERDRRGFFGLLLSGGALAGALAALAYFSLPDPPGVLANLSTRSGLLTHSLPAVISLTLQLGGVRVASARTYAQTAAFFAFATAFLIQLGRTWERPAGVLQRAFDLVMFLLLFATPWFQPWYITWAVALAALFPRPEAPTQAGLFSLTVIFSYVVYGFVWFWAAHLANWGNTLGITLMAVGTTYLIPWGYTLRVWMKRGNRHP